jgi:1,4-dihydroxy-2-naphthoate octaprenyltransferase
MRLVGSGRASAPSVKRAAFLSFGVAAVAGLALTALAGAWWLIAVGVLCIVAAWWYTGGSHPYGYLGLGEVMVFVFFGVMATAGTAFVMDEHVAASAWWCGAVLGLLAVAILVANNLRDIPTDAAAGKRTLAVRLGEARTRRLYRACVVAAFATIVIGVIAYIVDERAGLIQWGLVGLVGWVLAIRPMEEVGTATGTALIQVLTGTAALHAATGLLLALGLVLARVT